MLQRRAVGRQLEAFAEQGRRLRPFLPVERTDAARFVDLRALEQLLEIDHQRIGWKNLAVLAQPQLRFRVLHIAQPAIGHAERIVRARRLRIPLQHLLQIFHRATVLLLGQRGTTETEPRGQRSRLELQRPGEPGLGLGRPPLRQRDITQPHQRVHIVGAQPQRVLEERRRLVEIATLAIKVGEIVRPAPLVWREPLRIDQAGLGCIGIVGSHQQLAQIAVGLGEHRGVGLAIRDLRRQRGVRLAYLFLRRRRHRRQVRQRHGQKRPSVWSDLRRFARASARDRRRRSRIRPRRAAGGKRARQRIRRHAAPRGRPHRRLPSFNVVQRSMATSCHASTRPSSQYTCTVGGSADGPRPTSTRGSFADA